MSSSVRPIRPDTVAGTAAAGQLNYRRIVVKAGTGVLTAADGSGGLDGLVMADLVRQICLLRRKYGAELLLVTSGAIAAGRQELSRGNRTLAERDIPSRQALAAIGQGRLMHTYERLFNSYGVQVAQTLLTINDLADRQSYLNVRNTLLALLDLGVTPILNENDVVAVDEIGEVFGDNDRLSALVTNLIDADLLIVLTDTDGLYTADPRYNPEAALIPVVEQVDADIVAAAGQHRNPWARGGMPTKIEAARLVTAAGIPMVLCNGRAEGAVLKAAGGQPIGTTFLAAGEKLEARKRWMLSRVRDSQWGALVVDKGAADALQNRHVSLLPSGIREVQGEFQRGDIIYIVAEPEQRIACGIANYRAADVSRIRGCHSDAILDILGYQYGQEVVHRNNLTLL